MLFASSQPTFQSSDFSCSEPFKMKCHPTFNLEPSLHWSESSKETVVQGLHPNFCFFIFSSVSVINFSLLRCSQVLNSSKFSLLYSAQLQLDSTFLYLEATQAPVVTLFSFQSQLKLKLAHFPV